MKLQRQKIAHYIADHTSGISNKKLAKEVAALLLHEKHTDELDSLMRDVKRINASNGTVEVVAVSAHPLTEAVVRDIQVLVKSEFPRAKHVNVATRIEPDVVGGVRLEMPDEQLDLTIRRKLATFRHLTDASAM